MTYWIANCAFTELPAPSKGGANAAIPNCPGNMKSTLIELNIADDYFKAKALVEKLEGDIENKDKEIYDLKHDLISNQVKTENAEASMKELEAQNKELLLNKARLEATLEESLLDGKKPVKKSAHASKGANDSSDK